MRWRNFTTRWWGIFPGHAMAIARLALRVRKKPDPCGPGFGELSNSIQKGCREKPTTADGHLRGEILKGNRETNGRKQMSCFHGKPKGYSIHFAIWVLLHQDGYQCWFQQSSDGTRVRSPEYSSQ